MGTVLAAVGSGLISTFTLDTNTGTWIGYQIIGGLGRGFALQMVLTIFNPDIDFTDSLTSHS